MTDTEIDQKIAAYAARPAGPAAEAGRGAGTGE